MSDAGQTEAASPRWMSELEAHGHALLPGVLPENLRRPLEMVFDRYVGQAGVRSGLVHSAVRALAASEGVSRLARAVLGSDAFPVSAMLFDKTPDSNWLVSWHQDVSIPVNVQHPAPGFTAWSLKEGVPHTQPPAEVLEQMLTVRVSLDPCGDGEGPLRVIPGSHRGGVLTPSEVADLQAAVPGVPCCTESGDALVLRPLLLHASSKARTPRHRRVVHLVFAASPLPGGLEWFDWRTRQVPMAKP